LEPGHHAGERSLPRSSDDDPDNDARLDQRRTARRHGVVEEDPGDGYPQGVLERDRSAVSAAHRTTLVLGAFLMLLNSVVDVGKGVLFFPIVENHGKRTALAYLAAMIVEVVLLAVGVLSLLLIVPLGRYASADWAGGVGTLLTQSNAIAYQLAMMTLAVGNVFLWVLAFRIRLIPRWLSAWGVAGYGVFLVGAIAEIFAVPIGLRCSIPGGLFEVMLGCWLLIKGFETNASGQDSMMAPAVSGERR
jgi:hypothetical protein